MNQRNGDSPCSWIRRINIVKRPYNSTQSTVLTWSYQVTQDILNRTRTNNPKIYMEP